MCAGSCNLENTRLALPSFGFLQPATLLECCLTISQNNKALLLHVVCGSPLQALKGARSHLQVNAEPHMGSAYTTIAADVVARFQRLRGRRVTLVTGTDEHGEKIALAAAAKGQAPQQHCDGVVAAFHDLWRLVRAPAAAWCGVCMVAPRQHFHHLDVELGRLLQQGFCAAQ